MPSVEWLIRPTQWGWLSWLAVAGCSAVVAAVGFARSAIRSRQCPPRPCLIKWRGVCDDAPRSSSSSSTRTYALLVFGTRGDVQPVALLARALQRAGNAVIVCAPSHAAKLFEQHELDCDHLYDLPYPMEELARDTLSDPVTAMKRFSSESLPVIRDAFLRAARSCDVVIGQYVPMVTQLLVSICKASNVPLFLTAHDPMVLPHPTALLRSPDNTISLLHSFVVSRMFGWFSAKALIDIPHPSPSWILPNDAVPLPLLWGVPVLVTYPRAIEPLDRNVPPWYHQLGPWLPSASPESARSGGSGAVEVAEDLELFVGKDDERPVYIGFGSWSETMLPKRTDRAAFTATLIQVAREMSLRVVVCGDGMVDEEVMEDNDGREVVLACSFAPHEWLFPRCRAAVVHGGAGTMNALLRFGVPVCVVAPSPLQEPWGAMVAKRGVGTSASRKHFFTTREVLVKVLKELVDPGMGERARVVGGAVSAECAGGVERAVSAIARELT